eukprot:1137900-Pelagomonas_calceolata.AAC.1
MLMLWRTISRITRATRSCTAPDLKPAAQEIQTGTTKLTTTINTRLALCLQRASGGKGAGRAEVDTRRRRIRASQGMADNRPDPH